MDDCDELPLRLLNFDDSELGLLKRLDTTTSNIPQSVPTENSMIIKHIDVSINKYITVPKTRYFLAKTSLSWRKRQIAAMMKSWESSKTALKISWKLLTCNRKCTRTAVAIELTLLMIYGVYKPLEILNCEKNQRARTFEKL